MLFLFLSLSLSLSLSLNGQRYASCSFFLFISFLSVAMPVLFSFSEPKEAVKIVWECGPDASVAVKHCSLMARQRYRFCDLLQPSVVVLFFDFRSVVVIDLSLSNSHPNIPRRQFLNVVFGRGVWSERREKRLCRSHRFFFSSLIPYIV